MKKPPQSVIHIKFLPISPLFDARPIWTALIKAEKYGTIPTGMAERLSLNFGEMAIHLATRHCIMKQAIKELLEALDTIFNLVSHPRTIPEVDGVRVIGGAECERARDQVLLLIDSFIFEFRAFLDLLARFAYGILKALGKGPSQTETLSSGKTVEIKRGGKFMPHEFLLYICDKVSVSTDWYKFLSSTRNFFTHEAAPYCAIEDLLVSPQKFELVVMKTNIRNFQDANPTDYFRASEFQNVANGISALSTGEQKYVIYHIESAGNSNPLREA